MLKTQREVPGTMQCRPVFSIAGFEPDDRYVMEKKLDGFRLLTVADGHELEGYSRARKPQQIRDRLPVMHMDLRLRLADAGVRGYTVLDGELSTRDDDFAFVASVMKSLPDRARRLQVQEQNLVYVVFDVLFWNGEDVRDWPWRARRALIDDYLFPTNTAEEIKSWKSESATVLPSVVGPVFQGQLDSWLEAGGEGCIVKRVDRPYVSGGRPTDNWYKFKARFDADVVVMGFTDGREGTGARRMTDTIGAIQYGQYRDGVLTYRGQCSGFDDSVRFGTLDIANGVDEREAMIGKVMVIEHRGIQNPGFRHPQFKGFRDDKLATECVWDED